MNEIKLGPLQKLWAETLIKFPERQYIGGLGFVVKHADESVEIKACCLGQGLLCYQPNYLIGELILSGCVNNTYLEEEDFTALGLFDCIGSLNYDYPQTEINIEWEGKTYTINKDSYLAQLNDQKIPWPVIGKLMIEHPSLVFKESK